MPPGMWHMVYTPVGGATLGGHFLTYDTMHLTYLARAFDNSPKPHVSKGYPKLRRSYATNECQSVDRQILRMVLALPTVVHHRKYNYLWLFRTCISYVLVFREYLQVTITFNDAHGEGCKKCRYNRG